MQRLLLMHLQYSAKMRADNPKEAVIENIVKGKRSQHPCIICIHEASYLVEDIYVLKPFTY